VVVRNRTRIVFTLVAGVVKRIGAVGREGVIYTIAVIIRLVVVRSVVGVAALERAIRFYTS